MGFEHINTDNIGRLKENLPWRRENEWIKQMNKTIHSKRFIYPSCFAASHDFLCTGADIPFAVHRPLHGHMELYYRRSNIGQMQQE